MFEIEKVMFALFSIAFVFAVIEYFYVSYEIFKLDVSIREKKLNLLEKIYLDKIYKDYE